MNYIDIEHLEALALGAAILGSGGGGAPSYNMLITRYMIEQYGPITIRKVDNLSAEDWVAPIAFMGAPLVALEKIPSGKEVKCLMDALVKKIGKKPTALMPAEIGGANAFTPLWAAAMLEVPVLDADLIGRAFPELQMSTCTLFGINPCPAILADALGNTVVIEAEDGHTLERIARQITVAMGSRAAVCLNIMKGEIAKKTVVSGSITHAIKIGTALLNARAKKMNPCEAVVEAGEGVKLVSGKITDVNHKVEGGFLKGVATLTTHEGNTIIIEYQNEYLMVKHDSEMLGCTPDILMLLEQEKGTPITSAILQYGMRVDLILLPAPKVWTTERGLELVGPQYFGYKEKYHPERSTEHHE